MADCQSTHAFQVSGQNPIDSYGEGFGNKNHPEKGASVRSKYGEEVLRLQKTTLYPSIDLVLTVLDPEKMTVQHKRTYEVANISNEPIKNVLLKEICNLQNRTFEFQTSRYLCFVYRLISGRILNTQKQTFKLIDRILNLIMNILFCGSVRQKIHHTRINPILHRGGGVNTPQELNHAVLKNYLYESDPESD